MSCSSFRTELESGAVTPEMLAHMRSCPSCLELAVAADPDNLFRSLGGGELIPPGGVDAFVADVMSQVHLRDTEQGLHRRKRFSAISRWAVAAALGIAVLAVAITGRHEAPTMIAERPMTAATAPATLRTANLPAVESYEEASAMIVELPAGQADELNVVMIFDETLPVDL